MTDDFYALLKIEHDATRDEVKHAYRELAKEMHPDVNPDPETQEKFKEVTLAYEVLGNTEKRRMYDSGEDPFGGGSPSGNVSDDFTRAAAEARTIEIARRALWLLARIAKGPTVDHMIDHAMKHGQEDLAKLVLEHYNIIPLEKTLEYAVKTRQAEFAELFISKGTIPTPEMMDIAARNTDGAMADILHDAGIMPAEKTLKYVAQQGMSEWMDAFVTWGAQPTQKMLDLTERNKTKKHRHFGLRRKQPAL